METSHKDIESRTVPKFAATDDDFEGLDDTILLGLDIAQIASKNDKNQLVDTHLINSTIPLPEDEVSQNDSHSSLLSSLDDIFARVLGHYIFVHKTTYSLPDSKYQEKKGGILLKNLVSSMGKLESNAKDSTRANINMLIDDLLMINYVLSQKNQRFIQFSFNKQEVFDSNASCLDEADMILKNVSVWIDVDRMEELALAYSSKSSTERPKKRRRKKKERFALDSKKVLKKVEIINTWFKHALENFIRKSKVLTEEFLKTLISNLKNSELPFLSENLNLDSDSGFPFIVDGLDAPTSGSPFKKSRNLPFDGNSLIRRILTNLRRQPFYENQLICHIMHPKRNARIISLKNGLIKKTTADAFKRALGLDFQKLYSHQADSLKSIIDPSSQTLRKNLVVCTDTASGKSLIYNVPTVEILNNDTSCTNSEGCALFIFPTKALAQDQAQKLKKIIKELGIFHKYNVDNDNEFYHPMYLLDGDTPSELRKVIRNKARVILTNPDMLHQAILPNHRSWSRFLTSLRIIVFDEIHVYTGRFGTHLGMVIRRLRRIFEVYHVSKHQLKFIACSATISNPVEHVSKIFCLDSDSDELECIKEDGAPKSLKHVTIWSPPSTLNADIFQETALLLIYLISNGLRVLAFCNTRREVEVLVKFCQKLVATYSDLHYLKSKIDSYRSGYSCSLRRHIENRLHNGDLKLVVCTNALELGVDIGDVDSTVHFGIPVGGIVGLRQQMGRAGRSGKDSLALIIAREDRALDRYYSNYPEKILGSVSKSREKDSEDDLECEVLPLDMNDEAILTQHLQCAAVENFVQPRNDFKYFCSSVDLFSNICNEALVQKYNGIFSCPAKLMPYPAAKFSIRSADRTSTENAIRIRLADRYAGGKSFSFLENDNIVEELEMSRALREIYEGAIMLSQGRSYLVKSVNWRLKEAIVKSTDGQYLTRKLQRLETDCFSKHFMQKFRELSIYFGKIKIIRQMTGYQKYDPFKSGGGVLETVQMSSPEVITYSMGIWFDLPSAYMDKIKLKYVNANVDQALIDISRLLLDAVPSIILGASGSNLNCRSGTSANPRLVIFEGSDSTSVNQIPSNGVSLAILGCLDKVFKRAKQFVGKPCTCQNNCLKCCVLDILSTEKFI